MTFFREPEPPKFLHVLLIGSWASGKSHTLHTFPKPAIIDSQNKESSHFLPRAERGEFDKFLVADVTTFEQATEIMNQIIDRKITNVLTIGLDSLTPLHNELVQRFTTRTQNGNARTDYVAVKRVEREFGDLVRRTPFHLCATAEPRDIRAKSGTMVKGREVRSNDVVVEKESANYDDSIGHKFDYIFKMQREGKDSIATCLKAKDETLIARGEEIRNLTFKILEKRILTVSSRGIDERSSPSTVQEQKAQPARDAHSPEDRKGSQPASSGEVVPITRDSRPDSDPVTDNEIFEIEKAINTGRLSTNTVGGIIFKVTKGRTQWHRDLRDLGEARAVIMQIRQRARENASASA